MNERLAQAFAAIDGANAGDPYTIVVRGQVRPKEIAHAELATEWVLRLRAEPSDALLLAARAHHLRRWELPRSAYPEGRAGYLRWRREQHQRHADAVARVLTEVGYDAATIARVQDLVSKRNQPKAAPSSDDDARALEDALCLVFAETQLEPLADQLADDEKMIEIIRKTLAKMSPEGKAIATTLELGERARRLLAAALAD